MAREVPDFARSPGAGAVAADPGRIQSLTDPPCRVDASALPGESVRGLRPRVLAYVFWHVPEVPAEKEEYESALGAFHRRLAAVGAPGFIRSEAHRLESLPWLSGSPAYEDWYLLSDSAALDPLEAAAVGARLGASHDAVAARAGPGAGGLYKCLVEGAAPGGETMTTAEWLRKRAGATYPDFIETLRGEVPPGGWLWQRKMVLAPAPEFCIVRPSGLARPGSRELSRARIFPTPE
jgi:hypothetical protein